MPGKTIVIPYRPQEYQLEIHNSKKRFKVVKIGRRGGKTETALNELIKEAIKVPGLYWYVGPSYRQAKQIAWIRLKFLLEVDEDWIFNEQELSAYHPVVKTRIELKGADNEDSLRGVGLNGVVLDECAQIKQNVWPEIVRPMLADKKGWALFIGTPKGKNWFFDVFNKKDDQWGSWSYGTQINKYISPEEIDQARKDMSERLFAQEFLAEFLDDETGVFRKVRQCIVGDLKPPIIGRFYVMGVDLAKSTDFTVLSVFDSVTRELVAFERFQDVLWQEQKLRIQALAARYNNALCVIDSTGVGDPIVEDLTQAGLSVYYEGDKPGVRFDNRIKNQLIENLAIAIEQRKVTFPRIDVLIDELMSFEYSISDSGRIQYGAPSGKHDDCVISIALAVWGIRSYLYEAQVVSKLKDMDVADRQGQGELINIEQEYNYAGY